MLGNYLKTAFRNILKYKSYSILNILGLALGMAVCILILIKINYELNYDKFHTNIDRIYWVGSIQHYGDDVRRGYGTPPAVGPALKNELPDIEYSARYLRIPGVYIKYDNKQFSETIHFVDPDLLKIFSFPVMKGNPESALSDLYSIMISEEMAQKYFRNSNPIGKTLKLDGRIDCQVTGVIKDIPANSTLKIDFYAPLLLSEIFYNKEDLTDTWYNIGFRTFVLLKPGVDYNRVSDKIIDRIEKSYPKTILQLFLHPFKDVHLHKISGNGGRITQVKMYALLAALILIIAVINFMNINTARANTRAKEIGIRKVVGARKGELIRQFFIESFLMSFLASVLAVMLVELLKPVAEQIMNLEINLGITKRVFLPAGILGIALLTGFLAGIYPAFVLSSYKPVTILHNRSSSATGKKMFRRVLVVFQFASAIVLIICTVIVSQQHKFLVNKDLGYEKDNLMYIPMGKKHIENKELVESEATRIQGVVSTAVASNIITEAYYNGQDWEWEGRPENVNPLVTNLNVTCGFAETFNIKTLQGEFYNPDKPLSFYNIVINKTFADLIGNENIIGSSISRGKSRFNIIGVVEDFHFKTLYRSIEPLIIFKGNDFHTAFLYVKYDPAYLSELKKHIRKLFQKFDPEYMVDFNFIDDRIETMYSKEQQMGDFIKYFAILAVIISCLGLLGLAAFMAVQRTREIGIRKVLGASVPNILQLLSREFVILVTLANFIAWPVAYYFMQTWLVDYVYRISIGWQVFVLSGLSTLIIAVVTVSFQSYKAAVTNPVNALRNE